MNQLILRVEAEHELQDGYDWYEERVPGVGPRFLDQVQGLLEEIRLAPLRYACVHRDVRVALVRRFPYAIFYRAMGDTITVYSVFHTSRDPHIWQSRIDD